MNYALQTGICPRTGTSECRCVRQNAGFNDLGQWFSIHASEPMPERRFRVAKDDEGDEQAELVLPHCPQPLKV